MLMPTNAAFAQIAMSAAPRRETFMSKLGPSEADTIPKLQSMIPVLAQILTNLQAHFTKLGMEKA